MEKGNALLKVSGILMIIGGSIGLILGVIAVIGVGLLVRLLQELGESANEGLLMFGAVLFLIGSIIQFVAGIVGVKNAKKPDKAMVCIVFGILTVLVSVLSTVLTMAGGGDFNAISLGIGLVLPALYLIGAFQNKKRAA
jgi:hypothetical protein